MSLRQRVVEAGLRLHDLLTVPLLALSLLADRSIQISPRQAVRLTTRMHRTTRRIPTGTSLRAHVAMAAKVLSVPPDVEGVVIEAGCWKGGTTANLSLVAELAGRELIVYDSFEGLPPATPGDIWAHEMHEGAYHGSLDEVRANVAAHGAIGRCTFRKGWFSDTLPGHTEPVVAAFVDVDHQASLHQCLLGLWPHLVDRGYLFIDEYVRLDFCAVFFSERWWRRYFDRPPPGLMGAGTGVPVGNVFIGPQRSDKPRRGHQSVAWTRKDFFGEWTYDPDDDVPTAPGAGGPGAAHGPDGWYLTEVPVDELADRMVAKSESTPEGRRRLREALAASEQTEAGKALLAAKVDEQLTTAEGTEAFTQALEDLAKTDEGRAKLEQALTEKQARPT